MMEAEFLRWLQQKLPDHVRLPLGIRDDAALLQVSGGCLVTNDLLTDEVDFRMQQTVPQRVGRKALAVNLSDLAAMAARPLAALISLAVPREDGLRLAQELYEGILPLAEQFDVLIAGGDTNTWPGKLVISITALGTATGSGPLLRSGARPGDRIVVTGAFGGSILGKHLDFTPRVQEAIQLHTRYDLHAGVDVSDGLARDVNHMALASNCGAVLQADQIPIAEAAHTLAEREADGRSSLEHALNDGEDFELILAVPPRAAERMLADQPLAVPLSCVGRFVSDPGLWIEDEAGQRRPLAPGGWQH